MTLLCRLFVWNKKSCIFRVNFRGYNQVRDSCWLYAQNLIYHYRRKSAPSSGPRLRTRMTPAFVAYKIHEQAIVDQLTWHLGRTCRTKIDTSATQRFFVVSGIDFIIWLVTCLSETGWCSVETNGRIELVFGTEVLPGLHSGTQLWTVKPSPRQVDRRNVLST